MASLDKSEYLVTLICISGWQKPVGMRSGCHPPRPPSGPRLLQFAAVLTFPLTSHLGLFTQRFPAWPLQTFKLIGKGGINVGFTEEGS